MTAAEFALLVHGRPGASGWWSGRCPAHADSSPSLSFRDGDRALILKCWSGCTREQIAAGVNVPVSEFVHGDPLKDARGQIIAVHCRRPDSNRKRVWWHGGLDGRPVTELPLYGIDELPDSGTVLVVEGEPARDALARHGVAAVGTVTGAATIPSDDALRPLLGVSVVLWADADDQGNRHMRAIAAALRRLGHENVWVLTWPGARPGSGADAANFFVEGGTVERLRELIGAAKPASAADASTAPAAGVPEWPTLAEEARYGLAGEFVRLVEPHTEADPVALLTQFLTMFGNMIGRGPHAVVEADRHYTNLYTVLVGITSKGRKGTAFGQTLARVRAVDEVWARDRNQSGLSSGEGLIWAVRDSIEKIVAGEPGIADSGVDDKRLLAFEAEFASTLRVIGRDGNTLSAVIRQAWDTGTLRTLVKNAPAKATGAHVSIIGHVTKEELVRYLDRTEAGSGFANRFLWICVRRARVLPEGGRSDTVDFAPFTRRLKAAMDFARKAGDTAIAWGSDARELWRKVYGPLSEGQPGLLGAVTSRAEAQVLRLALLYALLDESREIRVAHLEAALALWQYCAASARYIFGAALGDPVAEEILAALREEPSGLTRTGVRDRFGRHLRASEIERALRTLLEHGLAWCEREETAGRPVERWRSGRDQSDQSDKRETP